MIDYIIVYEKNPMFANSQLVEWTEGTEFTETQTLSYPSIKLWRLEREFVERYNTAMRQAELMAHAFHQAVPLTIERVIRYKLPETANA